MNAKKFLVALAFMTVATSAASANSRRYYDSVSAASGSNGAVFEDAQHGAGTASQR